MTQPNAFLNIDATLLPDTYQKHLARLDIMTEAILYTRYGDDGHVSASHQVAPADLAAALTGVPITTGLLPKDCLYYTRQAGQERIGVYIPAGVHELAVSIKGTEPVIQQVPLPPLILQGHGQTYYVFAVKQRPGETERLYHAPLPNVNAKGAICHGDAEFPACSATTIHTAASEFLGSNFNDHLVDGKSEAYRENILDHWRYLSRAEIDVYPTGDLVNTRWTLANLIGGTA